MFKFLVGKRRILRAIIVGIAGAMLLAFVLELGLNWRLTAVVRRSFLKEAVSDSKVEVSVGWLSIKDIIQGNVGQVRINSWNCKLGKLRYQRLEIESEGIVFDLPVLLKENRLQINHIQRTRIKTVITESAFQEYLSSTYPELEPRFKIQPNGIQLSGQASVFGNKLPIVLLGQVGISGPKQLRFFPENLMVAGRPVATSFMQFIGRQIPLEYTLVKEWPLEITIVRLERGVLILTFKESKS